jgi:hypothetical protein
MRFWREGTKDSLSNFSAHFPRRSSLLPVDFMAPLKGIFGIAQNENGRIKTFFERLCLFQKAER